MFNFGASKPGVKGGGPGPPLDPLGVCVFPCLCTFISVCVRVCDRESACMCVWCVYVYACVRLVIL